MDTRDDASIRVAFHENDHVGTRDYQAFAAQWLAYALPCRRFAVTLTGANARLGADVARYAFIVGDFHLLLFAGFDRRTRIQADRVKTGLGGNAGEPSRQTCPDEMLAGQAGDFAEIVGATS
jgi:hypothetical protein